MPTNEPKQDPKDAEPYQPANPVQEEKEKAGLLDTDPTRASRVSAATKPAGSTGDVVQAGNADPGATIDDPAAEDEGSKQVPMGDPASVDAAGAADKSKEH